MGSGIYEVPGESMKEAKHRRNRKCLRCGQQVYGTAKRLIQHDDEHRVVDRAKAAGLVLPKSSDVKGGVLI